MSVNTSADENEDCDESAEGSISDDLSFGLRVPEALDAGLLGDSADHASVDHTRVKAHRWAG